MSANAAAQPAWLAPDSISDSQENAYAPQVTLDADGDAVAVWRGAGDLTIESATRPAGGSWGQLTYLSNSTQDLGDPELAVNSSGAGVAVWSRFDDAALTYVIQSATRSTDGNWSYPPTVVSDAPGNAFAPQVGVDANGNLVAVWGQLVNGNSVIEAAARPEGETDWSDPTAVSEPGQNADAPQIAIDADGNAVAVWQRYDDKSKSVVIQSATRPAGGQWSAPPTVVSVPGQDSHAPQIALDADGNAVAVWQQEDPNSNSLIIQSATRPAGGQWSSPPTVVSAVPGQDAYAPQVELDANGNALTVWQQEDSQTNSLIVQSATRKAYGQWWSDPPTNLSVPGGNAYDPRVALDANGNAVAVWRRDDGANYVVQGAARPGGGEWSYPPSDLSEPGQDAEGAQVALDPNGNAVAVWSRSDGANQIVQARGYDAAPPQLDSVSIPDSGVVGVPLSFSVVPFDVWSDLIVSWSFGDGEVASGAVVSHAYKAAGAYLVTVRGIDAVGNIAAVSKTLAIEGPAAEGDPGNSVEDPAFPDAFAYPEDIAYPDEPASLDTAAPKVRVTKPKKSKRYKSRTLRKLVGTASDESGVGRVEYSLAVRQHARGNCRPLTAKGTVSRKRGPCARLRWIRAKGREKWRVRLRRRLPRGRYVLHVRATDTHGNASKPTKIEFGIV